MTLDPFRWLRIAVLFVLLLACLTILQRAHAQVAVTPYITSQPQFFDNNGNPLASGCLFTYQAGTTTPQNTYTDSTGASANANPIILNSAGYAPSAIWLSFSGYKFILKSFGGTACASGSQIRSEDNITPGKMGNITTGNIATAGTFAMTNAGVFTNTQQNDYLTSNINGVNIGSEYSSQQAGSFATEAIAGAVNVPISSTVHQTNGVAGYGVNAGTGTAVVGVYGSGHAGSINNARVWGANFMAFDTAGFPTDTLEGVEVDVNVNNTGTGGAAITCNGLWTVSTSLVDCMDIAKPNGGAQWNIGLNFFTGATPAPSSSRAAIYFNSAASGTNQPSQGLTFISNDAVSGTHAVTLNETAAGVLASGADVSAPNFRTQTANIASTGNIRMARTDSICWRNQANGGDDCLGVTASDLLSYLGLLIPATPHLLVTDGAPTISSGFGSTPSVSVNNGSAAFRINVGTGGVATSGVIAFPTAAANGWNCSVNNRTAAAGHRADNTRQISETTTSVTLENQTTSTGAAVAWTASDVLAVSCFAY